MKNKTQELKEKYDTLFKVQEEIESISNLLVETVNEKINNKFNNYKILNKIIIDYISETNCLKYRLIGIYKNKHCYKLIIPIKYFNNKNTQLLFLKSLSNDSIDNITKLKLIILDEDFNEENYLFFNTIKEVNEFVEQKN